MGRSKKIMMFEASGDINKLCNPTDVYSTFVQERENFPKYRNYELGQPFAEHKILKPTIYTADESLRRLSPKQ